MRLVISCSIIYTFNSEDQTLILPNILSIYIATVTSTENFCYGYYCGMALQALAMNLSSIFYNMLCINSLNDLCPTDNQCMYSIYCSYKSPERQQFL